MIAREWPALAVGALLSALLTLYVVTHWRMTTDIVHFLPGGEADPNVDLARQIAVGELSRTMVLVVECPDHERTPGVSRDFEAALRADADVAAAVETLAGGPAPGFEEALWRVYQPRRFAFAAVSTAAARELVSVDGVERAVARLQKQLASPMSSLLTRTAPEDPLGSLPRLFGDAMADGGAGLGVAEDRFVARDGTSAVLLLASRASSSDSTAQRPLLTGIRRAFDAVNARYGGQLRLLQSGTNRHALGAEDEMKGDVERVSVGGLLGMLTLVLLFAPRHTPRRLLPALLLRAFAPLRLPLSWVPVLATGFLVGAASCLCAFGQIHGLTIAFGASLVGVSIDYAVHFYCHQAMAGASTPPRATMRRIWPGLLLGMATTVLGFVVLLVATFPGLRELALFSATGLAASLVATWLFLPGLVGAIRPTRVSLAIVGGLRRLPAWRGPRRLLLWAPIAAALAVGAIGLPQARWNDSLRQLNRLDPELKAEDDLVVGRIVQVEQRRLAVALGADEETALQANDRIAHALGEAVAAGELAGFRSAARLLPSAARQRAIDAVLREDPSLWARTAAVLQREGFVAERFTAFRDALAAPAPAPVVWSDLAGTPLASVVRPFRMQLDDGRVAMLSFLREVHDEAALRARIASLEGARVVDIEGVLTSALAAYRERMATLLAIGVLAVVVLVAVRYRRRRAIVLACVPALLGAVCTVAILALLGIDMNLLSLVALLMVVSMGVDYGIFLAEDRDDEESRNATQLGVLVDGLTTMFGFGLLALSRQPALLTIGTTAGVGVSCSLVLALSFGALAAPRPGTRT
jgi:predicted exporter